MCIIIGTWQILLFFLPLNKTFLSTAPCPMESFMAVFLLLTHTGMSKLRFTLMRYILVLFLAGAFVVAMPGKATAQVNIEESLAAQYYQTGEFAKAAVLYKKLMDNAPDNVLYYDSYLNCLIALKDYKTAEKDLKKLVKKRNSANSLKYAVDLGYIYGLDSMDREKDAEYDKIINSLHADDDQVQATAAAFIHRDQKDYAIKAYERGRKLLHKEDAYSMELGDLYSQTKDYQHMFEEYLQVLDKDPFQAQEIVQNYMQDAVNNDQAYEILKKMLLKRAQAQPDNLVYTNMLRWLFIQRKDFYSAYIQAKALDKKMHGGGQLLVELAQVVTQYRDFDLAQKIYQAVIDQGQESPFYIPARQGLLDISYIKITQSANYSDSDVTALIREYKTFLSTYGTIPGESGTVVLRLAEMEALYNHQPEEAIKLLRSYISGEGVEKMQVAKAKLALGDYSLLAGATWDASLYYSQVEKMYEDEPMGHEAKFRNAKLFFYTGDFAFAKADLDVLKGSTQELIANDAMQLSIEIEENTGLDSTEKPLKLFAQADFLTYKNQFDKAEVYLDSINAKYPGNSLDDDVLMMRAQIAFKKREYKQAFDFYQKVYTNYGTDVLGDIALFKAAELEERYLNDAPAAKSLYEKLILTYKGSVYAVEARNRFRRLRGDVIN